MSAPLTPIPRADMLAAMLRPLGAVRALVVLDELACFLRVIRGASEVNGFVTAARDSGLHENDIKDALRAATEAGDRAAMCLEWHPDADVINAALVVLVGRALREYPDDVGLFTYDSEQAQLREARRAIRHARKTLVTP